jgi:hypothetical protein
MEPLLGWQGLILIVPIAAVVWVFMMRAISAFGWDALAARYAFRGIPPASADSYRFQTMSIGYGFASMGYNGGMNVWIDRSHLYMRPMLVFGWFSPLVRLPLADLFDVSEHNVFLRKACQFRVRGTERPVNLFGRSGRSLLAIANDHASPIAKAKK